MDFYPKCVVGALSLSVLVIFSRSFAYGEDLKTNAQYNNCKVLRYAESLTLQCNTTNTSPDVVMKWYKNNKTLHTSDGERPNVVVKGNVVTVNRAMEDDVANYTCQLVNKKSNTTLASADIIVVGRPYVKLPDTVTVIEEEKLKLECTVIGSPLPQVEWIVGNKSYESSEGRVKLSTDMSKGNGAINNVLELEPAKMSDRGDVFCKAINEATSMDDEPPMVAKCFIRVKDKYAALWPFLGIVAEVIVLCTVIFIYEKKRNKAELEESDTDQSPEQKNTPDHGKESVRHRK